MTTHKTTIAFFADDKHAIQEIKRRHSFVRNTSAAIRYALQYWAERELTPSESERSASPSADRLERS